MLQPQQISVVAVGIMIASSIGIALWVRYLRRSIVSSPPLFRNAGAVWAHVLGCFVFLVLGVAQSAIAQTLALFSIAVFLLVACVALFQRSTLNRHVAGMSAMLSLVWLAYWVHETQLAVWVKTVDTPLRVDFFVTGPLLYFTSMVVLTVAFKGEVLPGPTPPVGSEPPPPR